MIKLDFDLPFWQTMYFALSFTLHSYLKDLLDDNFYTMKKIFSFLMSCFFYNRPHLFHDVLGVAKKKFPSQPTYLQ